MEVVMTSKGRHWGERVKENNRSFISTRQAVSVLEGNNTIFKEVFYLSTSIDLAIKLKLCQRKFSNSFYQFLISGNEWTRKKQ